MAARLIRMWFEKLCQFQTGAILPLVLCGAVLGAAIAMCVQKPPAAGGQNVQVSSGQVLAACQPGIPAASTAPLPEQSVELLAHCPSAARLSFQTVFTEKNPNAYKILEPDWGGTTYRLKTIVNQ